MSKAAEFATALIKSDPELKAFQPIYEKYSKVASDAVIEKVKKALESRHISVTVVAKKADAFEHLKKTIAPGVTLMNAHSISLEEIGFIEYLKTQKKWANQQDAILLEKDMAKQSELRRKAMTSDVFVTSVDAITESGDILVSDASGSRTGAIAYSAGKVIFVAGTNKIVSSYLDGVKRTEEYCLPLESARVRKAYGFPASMVLNCVAIRGGSPFNPSRLHVVLVKESLGY